MTEEELRLLQRIASEGNTRLQENEQAKNFQAARRLVDLGLIVMNRTDHEVMKVGLTPAGRATLDKETIESLAKAIGAGMNGRAPNSDDRDFAARFLHAYRALMTLERAER